MLHPVGCSFGASSCNARIPLRQFDSLPLWLLLVDGPVGSSHVSCDGCLCLLNQLPAVSQMVDTRNIHRCIKYVEFDLQAWNRARGPLAPSPASMPLLPAAVRGRTASFHEMSFCDVSK